MDEDDNYIYQITSHTFIKTLQIKNLYTESKIAKHFDTLLKEYYECIDNSNGDDQHNGALLLAVYRGRASEGILNFF